MLGKLWLAIAVTVCFRETTQLDFGSLMSSGNDNNVGKVGFTAQIIY